MIFAEVTVPADAKKFLRSSSFVLKEMLPMYNCDPTQTSK